MHLLPDLIKGADKMTGEGYLNASVCQRLFRFNLHPNAERIYQRKGKMTAKVVDTWYDATDEGATFFFESIRLEASMPTPRDRPSLSWYIAYDSTKLQYLAGIVRLVCIEKNKKLLILWTGLSISGWSSCFSRVYLELNASLSWQIIPTLSGEIEDMFNDPKHPAKCLIASIRTTGTTSCNRLEQTKDISSKWQDKLV